jgi:hypothetical protein
VVCFNGSNNVTTKKQKNKLLKVKKRIKANKKEKIDKIA